MNEKFKREYLKFTGKEYTGTLQDYLKILTSHTLSLLYYGRCMETSKPSILKNTIKFAVNSPGKKLAMRYCLLKKSVKV